MECLLTFFNMVTVPHKTVRSERMLLFIRAHCSPGSHCSHSTVQCLDAAAVVGPGTSPHHAHRPRRPTPCKEFSTRIL